MATSKACPGCGNEIPNDSRFCPQCGAPQALNCSGCGHSNAAGSRFCAQCGAKLSEADATAAAAAAPNSAPPPPAPRAGSSAERRQITVMFCDLVGSTALSTRLDPEDLREVIAEYHQHAADVVGRFGGFIAKYMGDGVLVYFGYPEAHETDAENAVRAGLALVETGDKFSGGGHQIRIGIATGLVVVGELIGAGASQERNVVGETPNLAARLQSAAEPNTVVIAASTRRLTGDLFEYEPVEPVQLKGFDAPVQAWRVVRERTIESRFEALHAANLTPLVGRDEEMELLLRRWQQVQDGEGRVVLVSGEAGIGKSRLAVALQDDLKNRTLCLRYFCLPHHQGSPLQPILTQIQHAAGWTRDDTPAVKRSKIEALLGQTNDNAAEIANVFCEMLGLADGQGAANMDPQRRRRQVLTALIEQFERLARRSPVLMLFEDAHWADPTSLELLTLTVDRMQSLPVLLVITFRPDFQPPWAGQPHATTLTLNRLGRRERTTLIEHVTGGKALPPGVLEQIVERTDGVPLFVEELTKAVLESEQLHEDQGRYVIDRPAQPLEIPTTLQASLMARVDRLGSAREVVQIGAAIGREFSYELIAAVAGLPDTVLQDALIRLTEAEMVFLRGTPPNAVYSFKHALVQDAAYSAMLRTRRQQLHGAIALVLEKRFPEVVQSTPEVVAQQFERAGQSDKAIQYWRQAGDRDLRRFALKEATTHLSNALRIVMSRPDTPARAEQELATCLALALVLQIALGPNSAESAKYYRRADELSRQLPGHSREKFLATWGLWLHCFMTDQPEEAFRRADEMVEIAHEVDDSDLLMEAYHARAAVMQRRGDFPGIKQAAEEVIKRYDRQRHRDHAYFFGGHDARVCVQSFYAMSLWGSGFFDQASRMGLKSIEDARDLGHAFSLCHGLHQSGLVFILLDDVVTCQAIADELIPLAERNKFPWPMTYGMFLRGWLLARHGDFESGIKLMQEAEQQPHAGVRRPLLLALIADQLVRAKRYQDALVVLDRTIKLEQRIQFTLFNSEVLRLRGEVLLQLSPGDESEAEASFVQAIKLAGSQSCRAIELRAATSLARLRQRQGRRDEARDLLTPIYQWFTEGFDKSDLKAAKALLAELN